MTFELTILGSSSALPTSKRFPTAQLLNANERFFLIDCGEGTQMQLRRFKIRFGKISHIFISHIHGDHTFGLFGLLSSFSLLGRKNELHIYGPPQLREILHLHFKAFDIHLPYSVKIHPLQYEREEIVYEDKHIIVQSVPLKHRVPVCGFIFREKPRPLNLIKEKIEQYNIPVREMAHIQHGNDYVTEEGLIVSNKELTLPPYNQRSYAYFTDTLYLPGNVSLLNNIDLLYHEATFEAKEGELARITGHSTTLQAAEMAKNANVKKLLLGHFSARYKDISPLLEEARKIFPDSVAVEDGDQFNIPIGRIPRS